ncbi:MAG: enoyl-CoA hydratase/isomerase family protein [Candidatus Solibacter sp.]
MTDHLLSAREGRLLRLTLNRPDKRNALDAALCRELVEALDSAAADPGIGAILLLANGKVFCAGMDLAEIQQGGDPDEISALHERLFTAGARLTKPLIAGVHGAALGGGTGLVANCHIVVAAPGATFGLTEIRLGLWPFLVYRAVEAALGERRTLELSLTGRIFPAAEACGYALVHEIAEDASARAYEIARAIAEASPFAVEKGMEFVHKARGLDWQAAGVVAREARDQVFSGADFREGIRAFREKRSPKWPSGAGK